MDKKYLPTDSWKSDRMEIFKHARTQVGNHAGKLKGNDLKNGSIFSKKKQEICSKPDKKFFFIHFFLFIVGIMHFNSSGFYDFLYFLLVESAGPICMDEWVATLYI